MGRGPGVGAAALVFAALLAASGLVVWRQSRALEAMRAVEAVRREAAVLDSERVRALRRVGELESRSRVVEAAATRLGMRLPRGEELVLVPWVQAERSVAASVTADGESRR